MICLLILLIAAMLSREEVATRIQQMPPGPQKEAAAQYALQLYGEAPQTARFAPYQFEPQQYIQKFLGWEPWTGTDDKPGQVQILHAYTLALRQQFERRDYELGLIGKDDLKYWTPGEVIKNYIRVEAGHTTGKTKTESGIVNHFLDCFYPASVLMYGPSQDSIKDNLWQELLVDRGDKNLPGRMLDSMEIRVGPNHFAKARVTSDAHGKGTTRNQGKHNEFQLFVLDEAEGIPRFVFSSIDSMTSGGIAIVLMVANPETRTSEFHKLKSASHVRSMRMSCLHHPNVVAGMELVPGAVRRHYVEMMFELHCEIVPEHLEDEHTFSLEYPVNAKGLVCPPGTIFQPNAEFLFRVLGIAPKNISDRTLITSGRYEAACKRPAPEEDATKARMGVDVSRFGKDYGTLFTRHAGSVWRAAQFWKRRTTDYARVIKEEALKLAEQGATSLHIRVDGGGGFGGGVIDKLIEDMDLIEAFEDFQVLEVHFNASARDTKSYDNLITEMHAQAAETLKGIRIDNPPEALEEDLCERQYDWVNRSGVEVKQLESKKVFRKRTKRSPDDGDGCVLALAPDFLFDSGAVLSVGETSGKGAPQATGLKAILSRVNRG